VQNYHAKYVKDRWQKFLEGYQVRNGRQPNRLVKVAERPPIKPMRKQFPNCFMNESANWWILSNRSFKWFLHGV